MHPNERHIIEALFAKLRRVEQQSPERDHEAEALIGNCVAVQPSAPYYLAQTVIAQEQALEAAQARITELERELYSRGAGGFLSSLLGGRHNYRSSSQSYRAGPFPGAGLHRNYGYGVGRRSVGLGTGGGFLAGAAQTAMGVAGGMLVGNLIANAFMGANEAQAASVDEPVYGADQGNDLPEDQPAGDDSFGDFDLGEF